MLWLNQVVSIYRTIRLAPLKRAAPNIGDLGGGQLVWYCLVGGTGFTSTKSS